MINIKNHYLNYITIKMLMFVYWLTSVMIIVNDFDLDILSINQYRIFF